METDNILSNAIRIFSPFPYHLTLPPTSLGCRDTYPDYQHTAVYSRLIIFTASLRS